MRLFLFALIVYLLPGMQSLRAQSYFNNKFSKTTYTHQGYTYTLYQLSRGGNEIKAKYFAHNAYSQYQQWRTGKNILLVTAGAFSNSWDPDGIPIGLCVDNGSIVNKQPDGIMDGMVIVYNGGAQQGGIAMVDMDMKRVVVQTDTGSVSFAPRSSVIDCENFLAWGKKYGVTLFQTQLLYSMDRYSSFGNLTYGEKRERRFLALCKKDNVVYHVVVDAPDKLELNLSASYAKSVLDYAGYMVLYIVNLDTGCKNILYAYNGSYLLDTKANQEDACKSYAVIEKATNLLVYYRD